MLLVAIPTEPQGELAVIALPNLKLEGKSNTPEVDTWDNAKNAAAQLLCNRTIARNASSPDRFWAIVCGWRKCKHCNDIGADLDATCMFGSNRGRVAAATTQYLDRPLFQ